MEEKDIKVKKAVCSCGKAKALYVIEPDTGLSKEANKDIAEAVKRGYDIVTIPLLEARKTEMCFEKH